MRLAIAAAVCLLCVCLRISDAQAQATYFQTPSADVPEPGALLGQLQGAGGSYLELETLMVVGLGARTELGVTVSNLGFAPPYQLVRLHKNQDDPREPLAPVALGSAQKRFDVSERWGISIGGSAGSGLAGRPARFVGRAYALGVLDMDERGRCSFGPYLATRSMLGDRQIAGAFMGCEIELVEGVVGIDLDWDVGAHALGVFSFGPRLHLGPHAALSAGARVPNFWGSAQPAGLLQLEWAYPQKQD